MKAERILNALGQIDDQLITELLEEREKTTGRAKRIRVFLLVAAILTAMTACAAKVVAQAWEDGWFDSFFSESHNAEALENLDEKQMVLMDKGLVQIGQSVHYDGYTITLESALSDGYKSFAKFIVEAPAGTVLNADRYYLNLDYKVFHENGEKVKLPVSTKGVTFLEDENKQDNRVTMLMETLLQTREDSGQILEKGMVWFIQLFDFGIDHGRGDQEALVSMEDKSFFVTFDEHILLQQEREVLEKTIRCSGERGYWRWKLPVRVKVTSFRLRALSATLTYEEPLFGYGEQGIMLDKTYVVMKDGTRIEAHFSMGGNHGDEWEDSLEFAVPIVLEDVAYVEFPGNQKVEVTADSVTSPV